MKKLFKNWEYVVLSRVRVRSGLHLLNKIDADKSFNPTEYLKKSETGTTQNEDISEKMQNNVVMSRQKSKSEKKSIHLFWLS